MEKDCMGLRSMDPVAVNKEEIVQDFKYSGFNNSSGAPWLLSNKETTFPHFVSSKSDQDQAQLKIKSDPLASPGDIAKSSPDVFDANQKRQSGNIKNFEDATRKQEFLGGIPLTYLLPTASVVGTSKEWFLYKASAQLTIFHAGKVNVFDDISPEKAQAIILLAGNSCVSSNMAQPRLCVDEPTSKVAAPDGALVNQSMNVPPGSALSSPISVSSHPINHSSSTPASNNEEVKGSNSLGLSADLDNKVEPPRMVTSLGSIAATAIISSAAPQSCKASLARFFEKRKERATNSAPYNLCKKVADRATPESG